MTDQNKPEGNRPGFEVRMTVPFYDLDPMQVVWHGNYLKYFEVARAGLFDSLGLNLYAVQGADSLIFPVVRTSVKYISSLHHQDDFICKATVTDARFKIILDFEIRMAGDGRICTRGRSEQVAVKTPEMELLLGIPEDIRRTFGF